MNSGASAVSLAFFLFLIETSKGLELIDCKMDKELFHKKLDLINLEMADAYFYMILGTISLLFCLFVILTYVRFTKLQRAPGGLIFGICVGDVIVSLSMVISAMIVFISDRPPQNEGAFCQLTGFMKVTGMCLEYGYNLCFCLWLMRRLRNFMKQDSNVIVLFHGLCLLHTVIILTILFYTDQIGKTSFGHCSVVVCSLTLPIYFAGSVVLYVTLAICTYITYRRTAPSDPEDAMYRDKFMRYYFFYILITCVAFFVGLFCNFVGFLNSQTIKSTELLKVMRIDNITKAINIFILSIIRCYDPFLKKKILSLLNRLPMKPPALVVTDTSRPESVESIKELSIYTGDRGTVLIKDNGETLKQCLISLALSPDSLKPDILNKNDKGDKRGSSPSTWKRTEMSPTLSPGRLQEVNKVTEQEVLGRGMSTSITWIDVFSSMRKIKITYNILAGIIIVFEKLIIIGTEDKKRTTSFEVAQKSLIKDAENRESQDNLVSSAPQTQVGTQIENKTKFIASLEVEDKKTAEKAPRTKATRRRNKTLTAEESQKLGKIFKHEDRKGTQEEELPVSRVDIYNDKKTFDLLKEINASPMIKTIIQTQNSLMEGKITVLAPKMFKEFWGLDSSLLDIRASLDLIANEEVLAKLASRDNAGKGGKSGEFFFMSQDNKLILKSAKEMDVLMFQKHFKDFYNHFIKRECLSRDSLIVKIYGLYAFDFQGMDDTLNIILMKNVLQLPKKYVLRTYDLKGSSYDRKVIKQDSDLELLGKTVLKDLDFLRFERKLYMSEAHRDRFLQTIEKDAYFFSGCGLIDYSLLVIKVDFSAAVTDGAIGADFESSFSIESQNEPGIRYHLGIIDYFQKYDLQKKLERYGKKIVNLNTNLDTSSQNPKKYAVRFINFMRAIVSN